MIQYHNNKLNTTFCSFLGACKWHWIHFFVTLAVLMFPFRPSRLGSSRVFFKAIVLAHCAFVQPWTFSVLYQKTRGWAFFVKVAKQSAHLLYMDDLKLFTSKLKELFKLLKITENFSTYIGMESYVDKCSVLYVESVQNCLTRKYV